MGTPVTFTSRSSMTLPLSSSSSSYFYTSPPTLPQKRSHGVSAFDPGSASDPALPAIISGPMPKRQAIGNAPIQTPVASQVPLPSLQGIGGTCANPNVTSYRDSRLLAMERRIRALNEENFQLGRIVDQLVKELEHERELRFGKQHI